MAGTLRIKKQGITQMNVDCVVNAANSQLQHGGGVCGAIFADAGPRELQAACNEYGHCPTGEAVITPGFKLKAKYIVHLPMASNTGQVKQYKSFLYHLIFINLFSSPKVS